MNVSIKFLCLVLALICFALATIGVNARVNLVALGLFLWLLSQVIG